MDEDEKQFIAWLRKQPKKRVFEARTSLFCPLAAYYREMGRDYTKMGDTPWMLRFILWFDKPDAPYQRDPMLRTLDGVEEEWIDKEIAREIGLFY